MLDPDRDPDRDRCLSPKQLQAHLRALDRSHRNRVLDRLGHLPEGQGKARHLSLHACTQLLIADALVGYWQLTEPAALSIVRQIQPHQLAEIMVHSPITSPDARARWIFVAVRDHRGPGGWLATIMPRPEYDSMLARHHAAEPGVLNAVLVRVPLDTILWTIMAAARASTPEAALRAAGTA